MRVIDKSAPVPDGAVYIVNEGEKRTVYFADDAEVITNRVFQSAQAKRNEIEKHYLEHTASGFTSDALGVGCVYQLADAPMITACAQSGVSAPIPCRDRDTVRLTTHTGAQLKKVLADYAAWHTGAMQRRQDMLDAIAAATTVAEIEAVTW